MSNINNVLDINATAETLDHYDVAYKKHFENAERAKTEYRQLYKEMVEKLSTSHLQPLETVLVEKEKRTLVGQEEIIRVLKQKLLSKLLESFNNGWEAFDISNKLATLAMLEERYKKYKGQHLHNQDMTPKQRLLPLRMRYKENSKRYLQKQIQHQNLQLEELIKVISTKRALFQEIGNQRVYLKETMEHKVKQLEEMKQRLQQLQNEMFTKLEDL